MICCNGLTIGFDREGKPRLVGMNASQPWNDPFLGEEGSILENSLARMACSKMDARDAAAERGGQKLRGRLAAPRCRC